jgi:CDP-paratose 2-epimerase
MSAPVLVVGGAGFIGCNLADRLLSQGVPVRVLDDLSRPGVERNLAWLQARHGRLLEAVVACVRDRAALRQAVRDACAVFHLAAQVAVTSSLLAPDHDFEVNARGTLNLLEELRAMGQPPPLIFTSTNKVYGDLGGIELEPTATRYQPRNRALRARGISERRPLSFSSPYGCSKGAADQYVLDYARSCGLRTVVFRMSCIYGPHQFGTEEQGWVAHFLLRAIQGHGVTVYGDGKQVRDVLFVDDLIDALLCAWQGVDRLAGRAFNIGGGPERAVSLLELLDVIEELRGQRPRLDFGLWRPGDQRYYVSDIRAFQEHTGWRPRVEVAQGVAALHDWLCAEFAGNPPRRSTWQASPFPLS